MSEFYLGIAAFLLLLLVVGLVRVVRGPTAGDRMMAVQLFGTTGVAILLLAGAATEHRWVRDVALVFALLAAVATVAFVKRVWSRGTS